MSYSRLKILPKPQGPFRTGCIDFMHGRTKQGTLLRLYYPTDEEQDDKQLMPWFPGYEYTKGLARFISNPMPFVVESTFNWSAKDALIPSLVDASVSVAQDKFPVIVFSHGLAAHRTMYSTVCNDLASHGFIVAAVEHRDESACATFTLSESGEKVYMHYKRPPKSEKQYPMRNQQVKIRAEECIEALNVLEKLAEGKIERNELPSDLPLQSFKGKIDTTHPILAGHSFGGATTILALSKDKRFKLGLPLDPWMFPIKDDLEALVLEVTQPMLIVLTEGFLHEVNVKSFLPFNIERNTFVTLKGTVHHNQSDTPFLFGFVGRALTGCWSNTDRFLAMNLNNRLMINFISKHLGMSIHCWEMSKISEAQKYMQVNLKEECSSPEAAHQLLNYKNNNNDAEDHKPISKL